MSSSQQQSPAIPAPPPAPVNPGDPGGGPTIMAVTWTLSTVAILIVGARFYVRGRVNGKISMDDWFMLAAMAVQVVFQSFITVAFSYGLGMHDADIPMAKVPYIMKWNYMSTTPAVMVSMLARISANILLTRLFSNKRWLKWFLWTFTAFQALCSILLIAFVWGQCKPVEGLWNPLLPARRWDPRIQLYTSYVTQTAFTISDLTYVLFPVIIIWDLHMPLRRRVGLALLMCLSLITAVASIMKTVLTPNAEAATKPDAQYNASFAVLWSGVEQTLVIILGCIAPLRAKFIAVMRDHFGWLGTGLVGMVTSSKLSSPTRSARAGRSGYSQSTTGEFDKKQTYNFTMETQKQSRGSSNSSSQGSGHELTVSMREPVRPPATLGNGQIARTDDFIVTYSKV